MSSKDIEKRLQVVEDILAIDKLEKVYGYYLDNGQNGKIVDMFSDDAESVEITDRGVFKGKEGIRRFFLRYLENSGQADLKDFPHGRLLIHQQHQGVIDVAPDGKTAKGRWYLIMIQAWPVEGKERSVIGHGVYENEFIKENGTWKFKKMFMSLNFRSPISEGWTTTPVISAGRSPLSDAPPTAYHPYPDMKMVPFHWE
ncbi:MAG: nuclear transport factor 2 family protein [Dehalococcoidales bacterium]|jgi:hypothetical protein